VVSVSPTRIVVSASRAALMVLPVDVRSEGSLPPGVSLQRIEVKPTHVSVLVPQAVWRDRPADPHGPHRPEEGDGNDQRFSQADHPARGVLRGGKPLSVEVTIRVGRSVACQGCG